MGWRDWDHMDGWGWFGMIAGSVLLVALVVTVILLVARVAQQSPRTPPPASPRSAEELLAERFARGEIDDDEYRSRLATLTGARHGGSASQT